MYKFLHCVSLLALKDILTKRELCNLTQFLIIHQTY